MDQKTPPDACREPVGGRIASCDLIVIGAGPGGYVAAIRAAQNGLSVALCEEGEVGGTCLNRGCIPTKTLIHATGLLDELADCEALGVSVSGVSLDFDRMIQRKNEVCGELRGNIEALLRANKVNIIRGRARIEAPGRVAVGQTELSAGRILIATGSQAAVPPIPGAGLPGVVTSNELLDDRGRRLDRLVIVGGGVIGVEFAGIYRAMGCKVTVVEALDRLMPGADQEISRSLAMQMKKQGVDIYTSARVTWIKEEDGGLLTGFETAKGFVTVQSDGVLMAVGRRANTEGLLAPGVNLNLERGAIPVSERFETCVPGIYAVGDVVCGGVQLAHMASAQATCAVAMMCGKSSPVDLSVVPSCVYTEPEIAWVGLSADQAKAQGIPVKTGKFLMTANGKSMIARSGRGFIKVVAHAGTGALLGAQMMCPRATDMTSEFAAAISRGTTAEELASVIHPHPTFSEGIPEALETLTGTAVHMAPPRR